MRTDPSCPEPTIRAGEEVAGFRVEKVASVPEIRATAYEAVHRTTGARFLHLHCADRENMYAIVLRTPPSDSTGVAHILEHSVLAGSHRYPVRDAFNELGKRSLKTFLNAFTAPDFTCYPVASQVRADFYNLASVYSDLVFRPLLLPNTFLQEGHHLEVKGDGNLTTSGIVYNEMKGAYSSPETVAERVTIQKLFPDAPYGFESGGHPDEIPDLTYEAFCEFHRRYYSPSNSWIFFYGDIPTRDHLEFLGEHLASFSRVEIDSAVPMQERWRSPRSAEGFFPIGPDESEDRRSTVNIAWLTTPIEDSEERLVLEVLQEALVGNAAAPLRKALIDSGLGEDLSPTTGLDTWYRQVPFIVGLRGTDAARAGDIERLSLSTLDNLAREGLPAPLLEAALHQVEFKGLEITRTPFLFPLLLLFRALSGWLREQDPLLALRFPSLITGLRQRWAAQPDLFRLAVGRWLVENPHRLCAVIVPSRSLASEQAAKLEAKLAKRRAEMGEAELENIRRTADALRAEQRSEESREALGTLPTLRIEDIPREVDSVPTTVERVDQAGLLEHDLFSNGIAYLDVAFDVSDVPENLQPYLPLLAAVSTGMGAGDLGYEALATRIALSTGGVSAELKVRDRARGTGTVQAFVLRGRCLARNAARMVEILRSILVSGDLSDQTRLRDILSEERNGIRAKVGPRGHLFAWRSAAASLSTASYRDEQWHGVTQLRFLHELARKYESDAESVQVELERLRGIVFRRGRAVLNLTGDASCLRALGGPTRELLAALPLGEEPGAAGEPPTTFLQPGVAIPGDVCYVGRAFPAPKHNEDAAPVMLVLASHLGDGYLYRRIRVEGGAYGGFASYNSSLGSFAFLSYRDPRLEETLRVFDDCLDAFLEERLDPESVRKAILGAISGLDRPMDPGSRGYVALERWLAGLLDADRQRFREMALAVTPETLRAAVLDVLRPAEGKARQAVYAPRGRIEAANARLARPFDLVGLE